MNVIAAITPERVYITPHPALRESISHYTVYMPGSETPPGSLTIVPDASGSIVCRLGEGAAACMETWFWGPSSHAVVVENIPQKYPRYIMIEFLPCGASHLLGLPMSELHNAILPLHMVDMALHKALQEAIERLTSSACGALCAALDKVFLRLLTQWDGAQLARHVVREVQRSNGTLRTSELSRQLGYSSRQIARIMSQRLGMSAKSLARIIRINAACRHMHTPLISLTELAHSLRYHDQSHFIHDFTDICGVTPGEYRVRMSHFYNEDLKLGATMPEK